MCPPSTTLFESASTVKYTLTMYQCLLCWDVVHKTGFCFCGRLFVNRKNKATGEDFLLIESLKMSDEKTRVANCPHCGWNGLVVPKLNIGCPEHGVWWYKPTERKNIDDKQIEKRGNDIVSRRSNREKKRTRY